MKLKTFENFDTPGEILLSYDGDPPTTWYYINDAIINGLLDEKLQLDDDLIEKIGITCFHEEDITPQDLCDIIIDDFEGSLQRTLHYLVELNHIDKEPSVIIEGIDEDGETYDLSYYPD